MSHVMNQLLAQVCALMERSPPVLAPDDQGLLAFTIQLDDIPISIVQEADDPSGPVQMLVFCGELPPGRERRVLRELLEMNLLVLAPDAPRFCLNPVTGHVMLAKAWTVDRLDARDLLDEAATWVAQARRCREEWNTLGRFIDSPGPVLRA